MTENLDTITVKRKTGQEQFTFKSSPLNLKLIELWQWTQSDLVSNASRGVLAEFIVAAALGLAKGVRSEWDAFDFKTEKGLKIEIKSSAYLQVWKQKELSKIVFGIAPSKAWNEETSNYAKQTERQANLYVFCLLDHKDKNTLDPLNLDQWKFYLLETSGLNAKSKTQKSITLSSLLRLKPIECRYPDLKPVVEKIENKLCG